MNTVHYNVSGITNAQSKTKLKNALDKVEGVQEIAIDLNRGTIEVDYNPPAYKSEIEKCIENTGYKIDSHNFNS